MLSLNIIKILLIAGGLALITQTVKTDTTMTNWKIEPSFKYDLFCFLNIMTGDPFYLDYYQADYDSYKPRLTPEAVNALAALKKKLKEDNGTIISAWLCLYFSAVDDNSIDELIETTKEPSRLKENFSKTIYHSDENWELFVSVKNELITILEFLKSSGYPEYWQRNVLPKIIAAIDKLRPGLPNYDVIKENEYFLGFKLPSDTITVYMLYFCKPHGIRITGTRFLTSIDWPFEILVRNAAHEMMHPPYDYKGDSELRELIEGFSADEFVMDKVNNHNPSFGYNTLDGLFEEDCVQSLDQMINESLNISKDARKRWQESDEGIHVLAIALYQIMKEENYNNRHEVFRDFLFRIHSSGKFKPGMIKDYYDKFYK
ncbi:MAG: hypothetical protein K8I03_03935 [Ignavibacteria bacterium]|nr:hypothetical protein [Ignavibacteria bacterium]